MFCNSEYVFGRENVSFDRDKREKYQKYQKSGGPGLNQNTKVVPPTVSLLLPVNFIFTCFTPATLKLHYQTESCNCMLVFSDLGINMILTFYSGKVAVEKIFTRAKFEAMLLQTT